MKARVVIPAKAHTVVITELDPVICRSTQMAGSSPAMTFASERPKLDPDFRQDDGE
jgi:hypothetical protein